MLWVLAERSSLLRWVLAGMFCKNFLFSLVIWFSPLTRITTHTLHHTFPPFAFNHNTLHNTYPIIKCHFIGVQCPERQFLCAECNLRSTNRYRQVLCANSFTNLAELRLHRAEEPALDCPIAEGRVSVKGGEAACEALDASSGFCYQPASSSCSSRCFMLMYFFPPHWVPAT